MDNNIFVLTFIVAYIPIIIIFSIMPYIVRKNIFFGVGAPVDFYNSDTARNMRKSYVSRVAMIGFLIGIVSYLATYFFDEKAIPVILMVSIFFLIGITTLFYINMWNRAKALKIELEWQKQTEQISVTDTSFYEGNLALSSKWFFLHLIIIIATIALGFLFYDKMPLKVPIQKGTNGMIIYAEKSYRLIFFMPMMQLFISIVFGFAYFVTRRTRPELDVQQMQKSLEQNIKYRYAWSCFAVFGGLMLILVFLISQLEILTLISNEAALIVPFVAVGILIISAITLAIKTGQSGSRINSNNAKEAKTINKHDDASWKLGIIYFNKEDASIFVEKRFGVGFTINFARPISWLIIAIIVIIIIGALIIGK